MPFTKFTNLDFDQIKESIKDYLRANSDFTGFDFEGSNFSVLIDTLAYNTYITAFNSNMIVNESFLDSATLRENVVSLARNIGYLPRSRTAAKAKISFDVHTNNNTINRMTLKKGLVCVGSQGDTSYTFSIVEDIERVTEDSDEVINGKKSSFNDIEIYQGTFLRKKFTVSSSLDQKFVLNNPFIDTSTIKVYVKDGGDAENILGTEYKFIDNISDVDSSSLIFLLQEVQDEKYELLFGDGIIGKKLENDQVITVEYLVTDGVDGNGPEVFSFSGVILDDGVGTNPIITAVPITVETVSSAKNGSEIESIESIKYYAPKIYSSQNRAVTGRDYESIVRRIYPDTESVSVVGGEELDPPQFGTVQISIKPKNGDFVSDFNKTRILSQLKQYSVSGINQKIVDLKVLYVELNSFVYYDDSKVSTADSLKSKVSNSISTYSNSVDVNKFGGRFKYSKMLRLIDNVDTAITSNITRVTIRRNLVALINQPAQYELCFGNQFHVNSEGFNIKSTAFKISGESSTVYLTDIPNSDRKTGILSLVTNVKDTEGSIRIVSENAGSVDYVKGEITLNTLNIVSTLRPNNVIEIQAFPESNDVVGLRDLYLQLDTSKTKINMLKDVISSGDEISGTVFNRDYYTSSYSNGSLIRE